MPRYSPISTLNSTAYPIGVHRASSGKEEEHRGLVRKLGSVTQFLKRS
jgi:hypothetical protein